MNMNTARVAERIIGPFDYDEAVEHIKQFARALTNLKLTDRFTIHPTPRPIVEREARGDAKKRRRITTYHVVLLDKQPEKPHPTGLTVLDIRAAESAGYTKPKVDTYEALGQRMTLSEWARAVGAARATLKARIDAGMTMEEAVTELALKRSA